MDGLGQSATILLVDDDESIRRLVQRVLTAHCYEVIEAGDGAEALALASAHDRPIHLLLTDIIMPKLNGLVLAERLALQRPETAVVLMSGHVEANLVSQNHPDAVFLRKPFTSDRLIEAVKAAIKSTRSQFSAREEQRKRLVQAIRDAEEALKAFDALAGPQ